jgi:hypothetical protein
MPDFHNRRGKTWHFVRRVPALYAQLDPRGVIRLRLVSASPMIASGDGPVGLLFS